jgi:hypothetical protein
MARKKKTVEVKTLIDFGNNQLKRTDEMADVSFKIAICTMVEKALHSSNNYEGFYFLDPEDCEHGSDGYYSRHYFQR